MKKIGLLILHLCAASAIVLIMVTGVLVFGLINNQEYCVEKAGASTRIKYVQAIESVELLRSSAVGSRFLGYLHLIEDPFNPGKKLYIIEGRIADFPLAVMPAN